MLWLPVLRAHCGTAAVFAVGFVLALLVAYGLGANVGG
jgi:hypothetical protein